ncbi:metalloendopeptidase OMA1, mitochondrial-like isoform X2 [Dysidea avara]|uniref:metalloendopeptidase OMA1, mitochondrial-like isoform X2 n=1 Tax=Dysidea avara TaxID=196820 RepID=UPI00331E46A4
MWRVWRGYCHIKTSGLVQLRQVPHHVALFNGKRQLCRPFRTSAPLHIGPWILGTPLARFAIAVAGRYARRWWKNLPDGEKASMVKYVRERKDTVFLVCLGGLGALVTYLAMHIEEAPITGRRRFIWVSNEDLETMSIGEFEGAIQKYTELNAVLEPSHQAYKLIKEVVEKLLAANQYKEVQNINWRLFVVCNEEANAMTYPTDELAMILGHEMSHAVLRHGQEKLSVTTFIDSLLLFPIAIIWFMAPFDSLAYLMHMISKRLVTMALHLPYSRSLETEADMIGMMFAARACYNPAAGPSLWSHFGANNNSIGHYKSTHPPSEERSKKLQELLPIAKSLWESNECEKTQAAHKKFNKATGHHWKQKTLAVS